MPLDNASGTDRRSIGPIFAAAYDGECSCCGDEFEAGSAVRYLFDELVALDCCGDLEGC